MEIEKDDLWQSVLAKIELSLSRPSFLTWFQETGISNINGGSLTVFVPNGFAKECLVSVAYAIGRAEPLMVHAEDEKGADLSHIVKQKFDFRPLAIIERLGLRRPLYLKTAAYGHFGKEGLPWEEIVSL